MSKAEDPIVDCPLDSVHRIRTSRLQFHLVRCLKNHDLTASNKVKCPFNPLHIVKSVEILDHCESCPDSASVLLEQFDLEGEKGFSGVLSLEELQRQYDANLPQNFEHKKPTTNNTTYDPTLNIENKLVYRSLCCEPKSKRKEFRLRERQRFAALDNKQSSSIPNPQPPLKIEKPLRQPHTMPGELKKIDMNFKSTKLILNDTDKNNEENKNPVAVGEKSAVKKQNNKASDGSVTTVNAQNDEIKLISDGLNQIKLPCKENKENNFGKSIEGKKKVMNLTFAQVQPEKIVSANDKDNKNSRMKLKCAANFDIIDGKSRVGTCNSNIQKSTR